MTDFRTRGVGFKSIAESIDTTTPGGKLVFHIFGALAEFEREIIRERTQSGLSAARARGKAGGRPKALTDKQVQILHQLADNRSNSVQDNCRTLGVSRKTFYQYAHVGQE